MKSKTEVHRIEATYRNKESVNLTDMSDAISWFAFSRKVNRVTVKRKEDCIIIDIEYTT